MYDTVKNKKVNFSINEEIKPGLSQDNMPSLYGLEQILIFLTFKIAFLCTQ